MVKAKMMVDTMMTAMMMAGNIHWHVRVDSGHEKLAIESAGGPAVYNNSLNILYTCEIIQVGQFNFILAI
jgi:hypothetical protein